MRAGERKVAGMVTLTDKEQALLEKLADAGQPTELHAEELTLAKILEMRALVFFVRDTACCGDHATRPPLARRRAKPEPGQEASARLPRLASDPVSRPSVQSHAILRHSDASRGHRQFKVNWPGTARCRVALASSEQKGEPIEFPWQRSYHLNLCSSCGGCCAQLCPRAWPLRRKRASETTPTRQKIRCQPRVYLTLADPQAGNPGSAAQVPTAPEKQEDLYDSGSSGASTGEVGSDLPPPPPPAEPVP